MFAFYASLLVTAVVWQVVSSSEASSPTTSSSQLRILQAPSYFQFDSTKCSHLKDTDIVNLILAIEGSPIDNSIDCVGMNTTDTKRIPAGILLFLAENAHLKEKSLANLVTYNVIGDHVDLKQLDKTYVNIPNAEDLQNVNFDCSSSSGRVVVAKLGESANDLISLTLKKLAASCPQDTDNLLALVWNNVSFADLHERTKRQAPGSKDAGNSIAEEAVFYRDQYPAIFNIIFWTGLILAIAVFAITYNMWFMDPGLDTVIYRMTSQRIKKDQ